MLEIYTIYGGGMWKTALDAVVTLLGQNTWHTLMRMAGIFSVLAVLVTFIKSRNPMVFVHWLAIFMLITSVLLVPKRSVQIIDLSDPAAVWKTDNVPVGLAAIASLTTSIGYRMASVYDMLMSRPDSVTYSKTGMLFGSQIVAETSDFSTQNPELAQLLPDYVENCVIGDILLNNKYTVNELLNSTDPLALITRKPSSLRGLFIGAARDRTFYNCGEAAAKIQTLAGTEAGTASATFTMLANRIFGNKVNGATLLENAMGESYGYFYAGGLTAAQIMKNNITNSAIRQGIKGYAARSSDTANLLNLATENAATKQRLSWAAGNELATRTLPFAQSLLMLILVCLFPLMVALAASNHSLFGLNTLKIYVGGFIYFQMWPVMFAILNFAANFWLQSKTGGTALVLANTDRVALQHSDVAGLAGYLSLSIPVLAFYLTKGAAAIGSQVAGSMLSSAAFTAAGVSATTADGNWSFNNMSMDNISQNKMDTNLVQRQGQQTWQADNGSTQTMTAGGHTVIDGSGAMSNLPVNMKLSQLASSGFQESARQSQVQAQTALDGYNHSVTSGWSQLSQMSSQTGSSDSLSRGSENSQATNATRGASMMMSAAESYAKANNISTQEAYSKLMDISNQGSLSAGVKTTVGGGINLGVAKWGAEGNISADARHTTGSSRGVQDSGSHTQDMRHDQNSQAVNDFRQGMDMVKSSRITDGANHTENSASSNVQQLAATLNDAQSQYHQYTTSSTQSNEFSRMATMAQNQSASLDTNYTQEFVDWAADKYGDKAQSMLTSAPSAREAAMEFVNERLKPEIMGDYQQGRSDLANGGELAAFSGEHTVQAAPPARQTGYDSQYNDRVYAGGSGQAYESAGQSGQPVYRQNSNGELQSATGGYPQHSDMPSVSHYSQQEQRPVQSAEYRPDAAQERDGYGYQQNGTVMQLTAERSPAQDSNLSTLSGREEQGLSGERYETVGHAQNIHDTVSPQSRSQLTDREDTYGSRNEYSGANAGSDLTEALPSGRDTRAGTHNAEHEQRSRLSETGIRSSTAGAQPFSRESRSGIQHAEYGQRGSLSETDMRSTMPSEQHYNRGEGPNRQSLSSTDADNTGRSSFSANEIRAERKDEHSGYSGAPLHSSLATQQRNPVSDSDTESPSRLPQGNQHIPAREQQMRDESANSGNPERHAELHTQEVKTAQPQGRMSGGGDTPHVAGSRINSVLQNTSTEMSGTSEEKHEAVSNPQAMPETGHGRELSSRNISEEHKLAAAGRSAMQSDFRVNQTRLQEQPGLHAGLQNDVQKRVAEQRSENERKINESAGEIDKKQSTVQTSSDILKGEDAHIESKFKLERKVNELDQTNPLNFSEQDKLDGRIKELRAKVSGGN